MAKQWQIRRGTESENNDFTGAIGEVTMDTTNNTLRVHDGTTPGGHIIGDNGYHPDLFDVKWSDHILNNAPWLRADTFSWQNGSVYQTAYAHLNNLGSHSWATLAGNGTKFVALGTMGYVSTSLDGTNWTPATQNSNLNGWSAYSVAWNGTKFVALGYSSQVSTSTDGINWTPATQVANFGGRSFVALAWNGTKFVALNSDGYISTSTDGTTWTTATQDSNLGERLWTSLAWDGTKFIALGTIGYVSTSTDGTNWTAATRLLDITRTWISVVWDGVQFVAFAENGYISTSTDGTSWSTAKKATNLGSRIYSDITYDGTKFVALNPQGYTSYKVNHIYTETIAGVTITYYLAEDGHKLVLPDQESNVTAIYNATGVAWYYIIDTANQRFKLPRTKFGFTGIRSGVGNYVEAGLPNITGSSYGYVSNASRSASGALQMSGGSGKDATSGGGWWVENITVSVDASRSSSIYGNSNTVQPKATEMYLYFYVGNFTQTALENTAGITTEEMNNKVNIGHEVIEFQAPTADNNYTWYRKYADGWVEQGGIYDSSFTGTRQFTFPVEMADTKYTLTTGTGCPDVNGMHGKDYITSKTTTDFSFTSVSLAGSFTVSLFSWQVSGMAA